MFMHGLMKLYLNRFVQNTESFSNESAGCCEMHCGSAAFILSPGSAARTSANGG